MAITRENTLQNAGSALLFSPFRLKGKYPLVPCLPVSAKTECILQDLPSRLSKKSLLILCVFPVIEALFFATFRELSNLKNWEEKTLHAIVDNFLRIRFPTFLVLNKCDTATAEANIERCVDDDCNLFHGWTKDPG